jgi:transglutaminase-like putative cysteine protease
MDADTRIAEDALDALGRSVRDTAGHQVLQPEAVVGRGRRGRRRRHGVAVLAAAVVVLAGVTAWRVVPAGNGDGLHFGGSGTESRDLDRELFTVRSARPLYWRLTALDEFDGTDWKSQAKFDPPGSGQATSTPKATPDEIAVEFSITGLRQIWAPTAGRFRVITFPIIVQGNQRLGAVIVDPASNLDGLAYTVYTDAGLPDAAVLRAAPATLPPDSPGSADPAVGLSEVVSAEARAAVGSASNRYDAARALQRHLRDGSYTFAGGLAPGDVPPALLIRDRRGTAAQFAAIYVAMARSLGIPARVVVGFLPGELGPDGRYKVREKDRHAWAEVWFEGAGWVGFDATPTRGSDQPF